MQKKLKKIKSLEEAIKIMRAVDGVSVTGVAEYEGEEYTIEVKAKNAAIEAAPEPIPQLPRLGHTFDAMMLSARLEEALLGPRSESREHIQQIPWLTLPAGYSFKVTFPFTGAAARFRVCKTDQPGRDVSVYLDTKDVLGCWGAPYWEAYPIGDDTARFALAEGEELIAAIVAELEKEPSTNNS